MQLASTLPLVFQNGHENTPILSGKWKNLTDSAEYRLCFCLFRSEIGLQRLMVGLLEDSKKPSIAQEPFGDCFFKTAKNGT